MQALFDIFFGFFRVSGCPDEKANPVFPESGRRNEPLPTFRSAAFSESHVCPAMVFPNRHESLKKIPGSAGEPGRKYRIELSPNYFLYLIAVPISLTVTVLIPQMQFIL